MKSSRLQALIYNSLNMLTDPAKCIEAVPSFGRLIFPVTSQKNLVEGEQ